MVNIILVNPQIPQNTGSIARTCAATNTPLHLVGKLGFELSEKKLRRAGLDYWPLVDLHQHNTLQGCLDSIKPKNVWPFSTKAEKVYYEAIFSQDDVLIFGSETKGLGQEVLRQFPEEHCLTIPIAQKGVRSLNLSNAVSIALYEAYRQCALG